MQSIYLLSVALLGVLVFSGCDENAARSRGEW